jgi:four helix bundle protein
VGPKKFEDLESWRKARELVNLIYDMTQEGSLARDFGLKDQLQRAAVSVMSNLAEGFDRNHQAEKLQFYRIAKASAGEVRSLLYILQDRKFAEDKMLAEDHRLVDSLGAMTYSLAQSLQKRRGSESSASPESRIPNPHSIP